MDIQAKKKCIDETHKSIKKLEEDIQQKQNTINCSKENVKRYAYHSKYIEQGNKRLIGCVTLCTTVILTKRKSFATFRFPVFVERVIFYFSMKRRWKLSSKGGRKVIIKTCMNIILNINAVLSFPVLIPVWINTIVYFFFPLKQDVSGKIGKLLENLSGA